MGISTYPNYFEVDTGWICPRCKQVWSPRVDRCNCKEENVAGSTTVKIVIPEEGKSGTNFGPVDIKEYSIKESTATIEWTNGNNYTVTCEGKEGCC